jgi:hypothetical protein
MIVFVLNPFASGFSMHFFLAVDFDPRVVPTFVVDTFRLAPQRVGLKGSVAPPVSFRGGADGNCRCGTTTESRRYLQ